MEIGVGWASPRISFSQDFVDADAEAVTRSAQDAAGKRVYSTDFEFAMAACFDHPQGCAPSAAMLPADELISHGKLLPFEQFGCSRRHSISSALLQRLPHSIAAASAPSLTASRSYPSARRGALSPPLSSRAPKRGAYWRELCGLKAKHCDRKKENVGRCPKELKLSASCCKLLRLFSRSRPEGSEEVDRLAFPSRPLLNSKAQANATSTVNSLRLENSSPDIKHDSSADPDHVYIRSTARLWMRAGGKINPKQAGSTSKIKGSCTSCPSGRLPLRKKTTKSLLGSSSFLQYGERGSTLARYPRIVTKPMDTRCSSNSSNNKFHEHAKISLCGGHWIRHQRAYSKVRDQAPMLLNLPACMHGSAISKRSQSIQD